jgi:hypothetical protein
MRGSRPAHNVPVAGSPFGISSPWQTDVCRVPLRCRLPGFLAAPKALPDEKSRLTGFRQKKLSIFGSPLRLDKERPAFLGRNSPFFQGRRLMKTRTVFALVVVALSAAGGFVRAGGKAAPAALQQFEALKKLAGDWVEMDKDGKPTDRVVSSIRVTSAGSAVQETIFPGGDHEMVTMYHLDGENLVLTHYCALGNQPRMRAEPGPDANKIAFKFVGATNLKAADEQHMHEATFTIAGSDRFQAEWVSNKDGKPCHQVTLDLIRKRN